LTQSGDKFLEKLKEFKEIIVLKSVEKLCFDQNNKKWANLVYLVYTHAFSRI